ncbi:MAG: phosphoenolpyruvate carboxykinase (ATP), partial [Myxococcota bacterium]|nr:phosphoenolpyruvate carboxykinase (ATP) [Myxococcota bacterium]
IDGYAGWDPKYQLKVRVICARAYHALFMHNMLIRPTKEQLANFGEPDYVILNSGQFPANINTKGMTSDASICLSFDDKQLIILGSQYAGEMKKGIFTVMHYLMPKQGVLSMHCSATEGANGDTSVLFGLSGTGKTTLSADPKRQLIGDDEHCWSHDGVFNIEGGCYAKMINLSAEQEPEIYNALKFGSVMENVVYDEATRQVDFNDISITQNTRGSYPIEYIPSAKIPCMGGHPKNVIFLTCDAFGVLPPVSKLTSAQAMYHFISGYTAKVAGTEVGVTEPEATFSPCFGGPFLVHHPARYAELLAEKMEQHGATAWLVNTGWSGGAYGTGSRMSLKHTRAIIDAIHSGSLLQANTVIDPIFELEVPLSCPNVPSGVLQPKDTWEDDAEYDATARKLAHLFAENFKQYESGAGQDVKAAGPKL